MWFSIVHHTQALCAIWWRSVSIKSPSVRLNDVMDEHFSFPFFKCTASLQTSFLIFFWNYIEVLISRSLFCAQWWSICRVLVFCYFCNSVYIGPAGPGRKTWGEEGESLNMQLIFPFKEIFFGYVDLPKRYTLSHRSTTLQMLKHEEDAAKFSIEAYTTLYPFFPQCDHIGEKNISYFLLLFGGNPLLNKALCMGRSDWM